MAENSQRIEELQAEIKRLRSLINNPATGNFLEAVRIETAHQRERWKEHDARKPPSEWFWTVAYLAAKAGLTQYEYFEETPAKELREWYKEIAEDAIRQAEAKVRQRGGGAGKAHHRIVTVAAAACHWARHTTGEAGAAGARAAAEGAD